MVEIIHSNPDLSPLGRVRQSISETLRNTKANIAILEGCTGGALCHAITNPGATRFINGGATPYSAEEKVRLGIPKTIIERYGEYSPETAIAMAQLAKQKEGTTIGIGITGTLDQGKKVYIGYTLGKEDHIDTLLLQSQTRRSMKNEITIRTLATANSLLRGFKPLDIPYIGEPIDVLSEERNALEMKASHVIRECKENDFALGTMESCTGLMVANALTDIAGCSDVFKGGFLAYNENVKSKLGVPFDSMARGGVYSKQVAAAMAEAVIKKMGVDVAFATTGVMDVWDTRPYHNNIVPGTISLAIARRGKSTESETISIKVTTRDKMKIAVANYIFEKFLDLVKQDKTTLNQTAILNLQRIAF